MLKGLEAIEVRRSSLLLDNEQFRLDSEFNRKVYSDVIKAVDSKGGVRFGAAKPVIIHPTEIKREYVEDGGVLFFRTQNLRPLSVSLGNQVFVSLTDAASLSKNVIKRGDVLVTRTGANCGDCLYFDTDLRTVASSHVLIIRNSAYDQAFLAVFLNTRYGRLQIEKGVYGAAQPEVAPYYLRNIHVPQFTAMLQATVAEQVVLARTKEEQSAVLYSQAECTLLEALGLADWRPPEPLTYVRRAKDARAAGRMDAEFFRPRYEAVRQIVSARYAAESMGTWGKVLKGWSVEYTDGDTGIPIIRSGDLVDIDRDDGYKRAVQGEDVFFLKPGDVCISSIGFGSIGKVQVFNRPGVFGTVSEVTVIRQKRVNPYFLRYFLRSRLGQTQIEQRITGATGQLHLYPKDVASILVPIPPPVVQDQFEQVHAEAVSKKQESAALLDRAKRAVEIAIEQDEAAALRFLGPQP